MISYQICQKEKKQSWRMKPVKAFDRVFHFFAEKLRIAEIRDSHGIAGFSFFIRKQDTCTFPLLDEHDEFPTHAHLKSISMSYKFTFSHILRLLLSGEKKDAE